MIGKEHRGLPGRIARTDDIHGSVLAPDGLSHGRAVEEPAAGQAFRAGHVEAPPGHTCAEHQGMTSNLATALQLEALVGPVDGQRLGARGREDFNTKALGLRDRTAGEIRAGESGREAEVVLDQTARAGLPARGVALDQHGAQAFRRAVDRGRKTGGPGADDGEVIELRAGLGLHADLSGQRGGFRAQQLFAARQQHQRQLFASDVVGLHQLAGFVGFGDVEKVVRHLVAGEEVLHVMGVRRPAMPHNADAAIARAILRAPVGQQVVEHRVEALLRRIPGFQQVVVDLRFVDAGDRGAGFSVGGQQRAPRVRVQLARLGQKLGAFHARHALV